MVGQRTLDNYFYDSIRVLLRNRYLDGLGGIEGRNGGGWLGVQGAIELLVIHKFMDFFQDCEKSSFTSKS